MSSGDCSCDGCFGFRFLEMTIAIVAITTPAMMARTTRAPCPVPVVAVGAK